MKYKIQYKVENIKLENIVSIIVWGGFIYLLFVFLRGMNETQVKKHQDKLEEIERKNAKRAEKNLKKEENK